MKECGTVVVKGVIEEQQVSRYQSCEVPADTSGFAVVGGSEGLYRKEPQCEGFSSGR